MAKLRQKLPRKLLHFLLGLLAALFLIELILVVTLPANTASFPDVEQTPTWHYDTFIEAVENQKVEHVILIYEGTTALVKTKNGETVTVALPNEPDLEAISTILTRNQVSFWITPRESLPVTLPVLWPISFLIPVAIMLLGSLVWLWMLIECATKESDQGNTKVVWLLIILFSTWIGACVYLLFRRPQRKRELGR